jgi:peptide subunit release factor 1 (eRF1)
MGRGERAASGLDGVLQALNERSVEVLLLAPGFAAPGFVCPGCGWMTAGAGSCPADSARLEPVDDVIEWATRAAVLQSSTVHELLHHEPERALGGDIAALLRF